MSDIELGLGAKRPSVFWLATEVGRALTERTALIPFNRFYTIDPVGDNHRVLVLPGFMASDVSTKRMRAFISKAGYQSMGWELGRNYAKVKSLYTLSDYIESLYREKQEKISLIGWSLGGILARQLAKMHPEKIRQVITMGSPFRDVTMPNHATWLYNMISHGKRVVDLDPDLLADLPKPAPVPTTAIYSKEDGIVPWQACMEAVEDDWHQNIRVRGSHIGLGYNMSVLKIIIDRLALTADIWTPFKSSSSLDKYFLFPT